MVNNSELLTIEYQEKGQALLITAKKVKVSPSTLTTAKKVKELEKEYPKLKKKWEQAKKGKTTIKAVQTAIQEIEKEKRPKPKVPEGKFELIYADPPWQVGWIFFFIMNNHPYLYN